MKHILALACLLACLTPANAQYGVSNARDGSGNLIRDNGMNQPRNLAQPPVNNLGAPNNRPGSFAAPKTTTGNGASK
jgi:hypothetical protein